MCNFEVASGQKVAPSVGPVRTKENFACRIAQRIHTNPQASWVFIIDQLNTHQSESLILLVTARYSTVDDLGEKGEMGILKVDGKPNRISERALPPHSVRLSAQAGPLT